MIKYGDKVKVIQGFYECCEGIAVDEHHTDEIGSLPIYDVEILTLIGNELRTKTIEVAGHNITKL